MKTLLLTLLLVLFFTGCIKEPRPEVPGSETPRWLISRITMVHRTGAENPLPGESPQHLLKQVYEYNYNSHHRLVSRHFSEADGDTLNLQSRENDTLFYDARRRVSQLDVVSPVGTVVSRRKFTYPGNDTLPSSVEFWDRRSDTLYLRSTVSYIYRPDTAMEISRNTHGSLDTTKYIYAGGNFKKIIWSFGFEEDLYPSYDNSPSLGRLANMQHGLAFRMLMDYVSPPVLSRNNWTGEGPQSWEKYIQYNADGLISSYTIMEPYPEPEYWTFRIEYFSPVP